MLENMENMLELWLNLRITLINTRWLQARLDATTAN